MSASVQNTVSTVFTATDKASEVLKRITVAAQQANAAVNLLNGRLQKVSTSANFALMAGQIRSVATAASGLSVAMQRAAKAAADLRSASAGLKVPKNLPQAMAATAESAGGRATRRTVYPGGRVGNVLASTAATIYTFHTIENAAENATKNILNLHETYEDMRHTFAGQIQAVGMAKSFKDADVQAGLLMTRLREMAAKLPGDMNYYAQMVQEGATALFRAGIPNMEGVLDFVARYGSTVYSVAARHHDLGVGARELFSMIGGVARTQMPLFNFLMQNIDGATISVQKFNAMKPAERLKVLERTLFGFRDSTAMAYDLLSAKTGEFTDRIQEVIRVGSQPLFVGVKELLDRMNEYLQRNKTQLEKIVSILSDKLLSGLETAANLFEGMVEHADTLWTTTQWIAGIWAFGAMAKGLREVLGLYEEIRAAVIGIEVATSGSTLAWIVSNARKLAPTLAAARVGALGTLAAGVGTFLYPSDTADETQWLKKQDELAKVVGPLYSELESLTSAQGPESQLAKIANMYKLSREGMGGMYTTPILTAFAQMRGYTPDELAEAVGFSEPANRPEAPGARPSNNYDFRYSRFDIKQNFAEGFDPDRIAVAFANDLSRLGEMKIASNFGTLFAVR